MRISLNLAQAILNSGGVVGVPTETVYGLAARASDAKAVKKIFALKGRPADNPLIVHVARLSQIDQLVTYRPILLKKLEHLWPGPLTVVLPANLKVIPNVVRAGLRTVAVRIPDHALLCQLIKKVGPLAAPSANRSGRPSPTCAQHVEDDFSKAFPVLDGGSCQKGVESTVIALSDEGWSLLRPGALAKEVIEKLLGPATATKSKKSPQAPGMKYRHYAPHARLVACETATQIKSKLAKADAVLGFADSHHGTKPLISLGTRGKPIVNLKRLYAALRELDKQGFCYVLVDQQFPLMGLGATLRERLNKAISQ